MQHRWRLMVCSTMQPRRALFSDVELAMVRLVADAVARFGSEMTGLLLGAVQLVLSDPVNDQRP
jgi:hypothetical protein